MHDYLYDALMRVALVSMQLVQRTESCKLQRRLEQIASRDDWTHNKFHHYNLFYAASEANLYARVTIA